MKPTNILTIAFLLLQLTLLNAAVRIAQLNGEVKVRRGLAEDWEPAQAGMLLENIDTILTLEQGEVLLQLDENVTFRLGGNAIIDIGDLRKISEKELFLFLMKSKVEKLPVREQKIPLKIANASVVHGESRAASAEVVTGQSQWKTELNGVRAMFQQKFYPNSIIKLHKIINKYTILPDCGETRFYLAQSLEQVEKNGQALEVYQSVEYQVLRDSCTDKSAQQRLVAAREAIRTLKQ